MTDERLAEIAEELRTSCEDDPSDFESLCRELIAEVLRLRAELESKK